MEGIVHSCRLAAAGVNAWQVEQKNTPGTACCDALYQLSGQNSCSAIKAAVVQ